MEFKRAKKFSTLLTRFLCLLIKYIHLDIEYTINYFLRHYDLIIKESHVDSMQRILNVRRA